MQGNGMAQGPCPLQHARRGLKGCGSGWHSSPDHSLHSLHHLLRLHNRGSLQLVCIRRGHIL